MRFSVFRHRLSAIFALTTMTIGLGACAIQTAGPDLEETEEPFTGHEEAADFQVDPSPDGKADSISPESFDYNLIVTEAFFADTGDLTGNDLQTFLEHTPYGRPSFLASERVNGERASDVIVQAARDVGINPLVFLARMQVEKSLVSRSTRPSSHTVKYAFGCGCPDHRSCSSAYAGLGNQIRCAGKTLDKLYNQSVQGTGEWRAGHTKRTLDHVRVRPSNHATAALYGYTPWVLRGRGGNWLVWNITRKFALHAVRLGLIPSPTHEPWVGTSCEKDSDCRFVGAGHHGVCFHYDEPDGQRRGFCSLPCEGACPDRSGRARTFCVRAPGDADRGMCVSKQSSRHNDDCRDIIGTSSKKLDRFVGSSGASESSAYVCWPESI